MRRYSAGTSFVGIVRWSLRTCCECALARNWKAKTLVRWYNHSVGIIRTTSFGNLWSAWMAGLALVDSLDRWPHGNGSKPAKPNGGNEGRRSEAYKNPNIFAYRLDVRHGTNSERFGVCDLVRNVTHVSWRQQDHSTSCWLVRAAEFDTYKVVQKDSRIRKLYCNLGFPHRECKIFQFV